MAQQPMVVGETVIENSHAHKCLFFKLFFPAQDLSNLLKALIFQARAPHSCHLPTKLSTATVDCLTAQQCATSSPQRHKKFDRETHDLTSAERPPLQAIIARNHLLPACGACDGMVSLRVDFSTGVVFVFNHTSRRLADLAPADLLDPGPHLDH
ncbi:hypothetical protein [Roseateles koreensis]|uniref:Uncharacterized protein n=1 Tax=Roseateles koreensis TaxID=2987526 RepID=A0ABT5KN52_9BURK|nr:hypothetical protein [Roseateles koreensis]MDC8783880.1 hypothetical protein [Roseateles koreensis]